jgi:hypothetical protein
VRCATCGHEEAALKTVRPRSGGASFVLCDRHWQPVAGRVWIVPGPGPCFGTCRRCGSWFALRELADRTGGGRQGAPTGICPACAGA